MKKKVIGKDISYSIMWSKNFEYDKHTAYRVLPELPGIICFLEKISGDKYKYLMFYGCWRMGLRICMNTFFDSHRSEYPEIRDRISRSNLYYKYTVVDTNPADMRDIMFRLIGIYQPDFNSLDNFAHTGRYKNVYINERIMRDGEVVEKFPLIGF